MNTALWLCTGMGLLVGLVHAAYVYRQEIVEFRSVLDGHAWAVRSRAAYFALWTLLLWAVLGATVIIYWLLALVPYLIAKCVRKLQGRRALEPGEAAS